MKIQKRSTIGLIELPLSRLIDPEGRNWYGLARHEYALVSKPILIPNLRAQGFDVQFIDLRKGDYIGDFGKVKWGDTEFTKSYFGAKIEDLDPLAYDAWGVTSNFMQNREIACMAIKHLASKGRPVVVGGSDAIAVYPTYLAAGATAVVMDKSGAANGAIMDYALGFPPRTPLSGVVLREGKQPPIRVRKQMHPEDWPLPEISDARECMGRRLNALPIPQELDPAGAIFPDIGCNQKCDFCQTPQYHLAYRAMTPEKILKWFEILKQAGAGSVGSHSDQFLGRVLYKNGREEIVECLNGVRDLGIPFSLANGLDVQKLTKGHGLKRTDGDLAPDEELISAVCGWDGKVGCYQVYIPAERPLHGQEKYKKLIPWQAHCEVIKTIVGAGAPRFTYGVIIGFQDDNEETLLHLEEALSELYEDVLTINPSAKFYINPFVILPIPGTPLASDLMKSGLVRIHDPIFASFDLPTVDTRYLTYKDIAKWQIRLTKIGTPRDSAFYQLRNDYI